MFRIDHEWLGGQKRLFWKFRGWSIIPKSQGLLVLAIFSFWFKVQHYSINGTLFWTGRSVNLWLCCTLFHINWNWGRTLDEWTEHMVCIGNSVSPDPRQGNTSLWNPGKLLPVDNILLSSLKVQCSDCSPLRCRESCKGFSGALRTSCGTDRFEEKSPSVLLSLEMTSSFLPWHTPQVGRDRAFWTGGLRPTNLRTTGLYLSDWDSPYATRCHFYHDIVIPLVYSVPEPWN